MPPFRLPIGKAKVNANQLAFAIGVIFFSFTLFGCGGGASSNGGGGGGSGLSISILAPSTVAVGLPQGGVTVFGQGFTQQSQVLIDGQPAPLTTFTDSGTMQAEVNTSLSATPGTHRFSVQNGGQVSNSLTYTVYSSQPAPNVMQALPGFLVAENESDAPFIVAADVNGDGRADVIINGLGLTNSGGIAILYGQADGTLSSPQKVAIPISPNALAVGDVDGNGTPDLVTATSESGSSTITVSILLGDGHGNFQPPVTQQTFAGINPGPVYLADLDGDGKLDLVLGVAPSFGTVWSIVWLKNTGGGFGAPATLTSAYSNFYTVGDFDGDGKPDLIYEAAGPPQVMHVLLNQGNGQFKDQVAGGLNGVVGVPTVLDFDLDGIVDLVLEVSNSTGDQLYSFKGDGNGSFTQVAVLNTPPIAQLVVGDFDHDGFPDLAGPGGNEPAEMSYFYGDGHGNFTSQTVVGPEGQYAAVGDFNGDGILDVVVPDRFSFVSLALGRNGRNFQSPLALFPATMTQVSTGDITGNGLQDIFVAGNFINVSIPGTVFLNQGGTSFALAAHTDPTSFVVADLTGKGVVDLLGGNTNLEIWPNNGTPNFSSSPITFSQSTANIAVADMDGDGHPDVISATGQIFYGNGAYRFTPVTVTNSNWGPYVIGDFNGDGKLDIATGEGTFLNTGNRTFQQVTNSNVPLTNGVLAVVGDFNGDGKDDIALNLPGDPSIAIYYSKGDGTFYEATVLDAGQEPAVMVVGDFNGDGRADLAAGLLLSEQVTILFNAGNGQFTRSFFASGALAAAMTTSDLNHTGKPDLVIGNFVFDFAPPNVNVVFHQ